MRVRPFSHRPDPTFFIHPGKDIQRELLYVIHPIALTNRQRRSIWMIRSFHVFRVQRVLLTAGALCFGCSTPSSSLPPAVPQAVQHSVLPPSAATTAPVDPVISRIREQGLQHSQIEETLDYLCNVIGQRLTASPSQAAASQWTCDTLSQWGLVNAHLEDWAPFGHGWRLEQFSLRMIEPTIVQLHAFPKAWSPGFDSSAPLEVVYLDAKNLRQLSKFKGQLAGKAVLIGTVRPTDAHFEPQAQRMTPSQLATLGAAPSGRSKTEMLSPATEPSSQPAGKTTATQSTASASPTSLSLAAAASFANEEIDFAAREHAAIILDASIKGDGGTIFVAGASVPLPATRPSTSATRSASIGPTTRPKPWAVDSSTIPPQATLSIEDFNRLVRMLRRNQHVSVSMVLKVREIPQDQTHLCNTIAEIPGSDLKDEIVMVGGHLDSWHAGTGATDNAVGAACAMEAVRILKALELHPRRTIRVALWTGEEEGMLGSTAYVKQHFGSLPDDPATQPATQPVTQPTKPNLDKLLKKAEYSRLSVYFNLDNGTGKIRGIYAQSNPLAVPYFRSWLQPFADLDASTVSLANTGSTDHISFDRIGLPGFQFIQDPIEYMNRTHHSNEDVFDRIQMQDMKQAATIMAAFLWDAANMDRRFPRKR
jgi:hypothetical protein